MCALREVVLSELYKHRTPSSGTCAEFLLQLFGTL